MFGLVWSQSVTKHEPQCQKTFTLLMKQEYFCLQSSNFICMLFKVTKVKVIVPMEQSSNLAYKMRTFLPMSINFICRLFITISTIIINF